MDVRTLSGPGACNDAEQDALKTIERVCQHAVQSGTESLELRAPDGQRVALPSCVSELLGEMVHILARGDAVAVVPVYQELTTKEAADLLGVSRQYLVTLLERREIPHHKAGTHRRIRLRDLMDYRERRDETRRIALRELTRQGQELEQYR